MNSVFCIFWLRRAAESGHVSAQFQMGVIHATAEGEARDLSAAAHWYRRAAENGDRYAQHNLATMLAEGEGVEKNVEEAARLFSLAANSGLADGADGGFARHDSGESAGFFICAHIGTFTLSF